MLLREIDNITVDNTMTIKSFIAKIGVTKFRPFDLQEIAEHFDKREFDTETHTLTYYLVCETVARFCPSYFTMVKQTHNHNMNFYRIYFMKQS